MIGIYKITNPKGKVYIGQSHDVIGRFKTYKRYDCKNQQKLYNSLRKYSHEKHQFEIVEECLPNELNGREIYWVDYFQSTKKGLNIREGGEGGGLHSEETKKKMSLSHTGKMWTEEQKENYIKSKTNHPMYNDEWRDSISKSLLGREVWWNDKISKARKGLPSPFKGKNHSTTTKNKMSENRKGNPKYNNIHKMTIVYQYDLDGNFIKQWDSIEEAKKTYKGDISACCRGRQKTASKFKWSYEQK